jgi:hypothetical protein
MKFIAYVTRTRDETLLSTDKRIITDQEENIAAARYRALCLDFILKAC